MPEIPADFHFLRPEWVWMLIPAALLLAALWRHRLRQAGLELICDTALLPHLLIGQEQRDKKRPMALLSLAWLLAVTALAGPVWQQQPQPVYRLESGRVLVLDLSPSMAATDITPSRLERARYKIKDILKKSREGHTALVVFSADPHVVVPLTDDVATIASLLPALAVDIMPEFGDTAGSALEKAASLLLQGGLKGGDILLITDGIDDIASSLAKAEALRKKGFRLSVLGVGSTNGAPVPDPAGSGFMTDDRGTPRLARLDTSSLQALAASGGGRYSTFTTDEQDLDTLLIEDGGRRLNSGEATNKNIDRWQEEGVWLVLPILFLALIGFRRGWLVTILVLLALRPDSAQAMNWQDLWQRPNQQAAQQLAAGNAKKAAELFTNPAWRAVAQHEAGDYQAAIETGSKVNNADGQYNLGTTLAKTGQLEQALAAYDKALKLHPDDADARHNQELVRQLLKQQKKEQQDTKPNDGNQQDQQDKQENGSPSSQQQSDKHKEGQQQQTNGNEEDRLAQSQNADQEQQQDRPTGQKQNDQGQPARPEQQKTEAEPPHTPRQEMTEVGKDDRQASVEQQAPLASVQPENPEQEVTEKDLALEQWLRQVPDDPSGLLRRKFMLEHQRRLQKRKQP